MASPCNCPVTYMPIESEQHGDNCPVTYMPMHVLQKLVRIGSAGEAAKF